MEKSNQANVMDARNRQGFAGDEKGNPHELVTNAKVVQWENANVRHLVSHNLCREKRRAWQGICKVSKLALFQRNEAILSVGEGRFADRRLAS